VNTQIQSVKVVKIRTTMAEIQHFFFVFIGAPCKSCAT